MAATRAIPIAAIACACVLLAGCGGGGGAGPPGAGGYGSIEGDVFVPSGRSGAAFAAADRGAPPAGYEPLVGATVRATLGAVNRTAATDASGHFVISGVPAGRASVRITPPAGASYHEFISSVDVTAGATAPIGQDGEVSLLSGTAASVSVTVDSVDTSGWPTVRVKASVLDPAADKALIGMTPADFALVLNGATASLSGLTTELSGGAKPHQVYVLSSIASGAAPGFVRAELSAGFCGRTGSASGHTTMPTAFLSPMPAMSVTNAFKAADYAAQYPGQWHMGADLSAVVNARVNAVAVGEVMGVIGFAQDTGVVVRHRVSADLNTSGGPTRDIYVLYGCITPGVGAGTAVEPGQAVGYIRSHVDGPHLHLGVRVGEGITSVWDGNLDGGAIPPADAFGLTDGYTDPMAFLAAKTPDNTPL